MIYGVPAAEPPHLGSRPGATAFALSVPHVSAYALTIEPGTAFGHRLQKGTFVAPPDEFVAEQFEMLLAATARPTATSSTKSATSAGPAARAATTPTTGAACPTWAWARAPTRFDGHSRPVHRGQQPAVRGRRAGARRSAQPPSST
ncbi:MAG: hypothetical protein WKG07_44970 [Hymenobacter sp.]